MGCKPEIAPVGELVPMGFDTEPLLLDFPVEERELIETRWLMGFDHDPVEYSGIEDAICTAYDGSGYPSCYDSHDGTDFDLRGGFDTMDAGSAEVLAAVEGYVDLAVDGNYDRCHLADDGLGVDCDGHPREPNLVRIEHLGGWRTSYKHLALDSVLVEPGDWVERGQPIGLIGASGWSTAPHLHLELIDPSGERIDPFAGEFSQESSYWCEQFGGDGLPGYCDG